MATGLVETIWLFVRGSESVRLIRASTPDGGARLLVHGPGTAQATHDFVDGSSCTTRQAELERELVKTGFSLEEFTDRRNGEDRRRIARTTPDRRRI